MSIPPSNFPPPPGQPPYGAPGGPPPYGAPAPVNGQTILIMGIASLFCFGIILGPLALIQGNAALKTLDTYGDPTNQRSPVTTGRICGLIGTILAVLGIVGYIIAMVAGLATGFAPHQSYTPTP